MFVSMGSVGVCARLSGPASDVCLYPCSWMRWVGPVFSSQEAVGSCPLLMVLTLAATKTTGIRSWQACGWGELRVLVMVVLYQSETKSKRTQTHEEALWWWPLGQKNLSLFKAIVFIFFTRLTNRKGLYKASFSLCTCFLWPEGKGGVSRWCDQPWLPPLICDVDKRKWIARTAQCMVDTEK